MDPVQTKANSKGYALFVKQSLYNNFAKTSYEKMICDFVPGFEFKLDATWEANFDQGKVLYKLGQGLLRLYNEPPEDFGIPEDEMDEAMYLLQFNRVMRKLKIPPEHVFTATDISDHNGLKIILTLDLLLEKYNAAQKKLQPVFEKFKKGRQKKQNTDHQGYHHHPHRKHHEPEPKPEPQSPKIVDQTEIPQELKKEEQSSLDALKDLVEGFVGYAMNTGVAEYDSQTADLFVKQDELMEQWALFKIVKDRGSAADFDHALNIYSSDPGRWDSQLEVFRNFSPYLADYEGKEELHPYGRYNTEHADEQAQLDTKKKSLIEVRGVFGETILHLCILYRNYSLLVHISQKYPQLVNQHKTHPLYLGETPIHMLAAKGRYSETQFFVKKGVDLSRKCYGKFYMLEKGKIYRGETPLSFATCVENIDHAKKVVELLLSCSCEHPADLLEPDRFGNTLLHILAYNNKAEIYKFLNSNANWKIKCEIMEKEINHKGMTPLHYAASLGNKEILSEMLAQRRQLQWKYLTCASYAYPLKEIDSLSHYAKPLIVIPYLTEIIQSGIEKNDIQEPGEVAGAASSSKEPEEEQVHEDQQQNSNGTKKDQPKGNVSDQTNTPKKVSKKDFVVSKSSVLELIVYTPNLTVESKKKRSEMLHLPVIHQLLDEKWARYAGICFYVWLLNHMALLACITTFAIWGTEPTFPRHAFWGLQAYILFYAIISLVFEIIDMFYMGVLYRYMSAFYSHLSSCIFSLFIIANFILNFFGATQMDCALDQFYENQLSGVGPTNPAELPILCTVSNSLLAVACFFAWAFILYFSRGFSGLGLFSVSMQVMIIQNMIPFGIVFFILIMALTLGLFLIWSADITMYQFGVGLLSTLEISLFSTNFGVDAINTSIATPLVVIFFLLILFLLGILMINMLIASMGNTYQTIRGEAEDQLFFEWASSMLLIERRCQFILNTIGLKLPPLGFFHEDKKEMYLKVEEQEEPDLK